MKIIVLNNSTLILFREIYLLPFSIHVFLSLQIVFHHKKTKRKKKVFTHDSIKSKKCNSTFLVLRKSPPLLIRDMVVVSYDRVQDPGTKSGQRA